MQLLASHPGQYGEIAIMEEVDTGFRWYLEGTAFQSYAGAGGDSRFAYVHLMAALLGSARRVLVLGCGGGTLATMLDQRGVDVLVVDRNPMSFDLARRYFWMPESVRCIAADFRDYLRDRPDAVDAIAIDVGTDSFDFCREFDPATCGLIRRALPSGGAIVLNLILAHDLDPSADILASRLAEGSTLAWIADQTGVTKRNAVLAVGPGRRPKIRLDRCPDDIKAKLATWRLRPPRQPSPAGPPGR